MLFVAKLILVTFELTFVEQQQFKPSKIIAYIYL